MKPFKTETGPVAVLSLDNIDTDQLIPARFLRRTRAQGYGDYLLYDLRFFEDGSQRPDFPLNERAQAPTVLIAGENFGCGSSREAAVYALADHGVRVVIAPSFADIFRNNAIENGLLPLQLSGSRLDELIAALKPLDDPHLKVSLEQMSVKVAPDGPTFDFELEGDIRQRLLEGLDAITRTRKHTREIDAFETRRFARAPWLSPLSSSQAPSPTADPNDH